jgi:alkylation response protein AidB-like acyl-CoA dehydrogenase
MDFNDSPEEAAFRAEARAWLEKTLGQPGARTGARPDSAEWLQTAKAYQAKKAAAGYVGLTWRKEVGGRELSPIIPSSSDRRNNSSRRRLRHSPSDLACASPR